MRFAKISRRLTLTLYFGQFHFPDSLTRFTEAERKYISVRDVTNVDREMNARNMRYEYRGQEIKQNCKSWNNRLPFYISDLLRPTFDIITDRTSFLIRRLLEKIIRSNRVGGAGGGEEGRVKLNELINKQTIFTRGYLLYKGVYLREICYKLIVDRLIWIFILNSKLCVIVFILY